MSGRRFLRTRSVIAVLAVLLGTACTSSPQRPTSLLQPPPPGSIIAFSQNTAGTPLVAFDVRGETVRSEGGDVRQPLASASRVSGHGLTGVVVTAKGTVSVVRLSAGGNAVQVGPVYDGRRNAPYRSLAVAGGRAMAADCRAVVVLDTSGASRWTTVGKGCWAALSSNGSIVAFSPDGVHVFDERIGMDHPHPMFDIEGLDLGTERPARLFGAPAWVPDGIAFTVVAGNQAAIYVRRSDGRLVQLLQERLLKTVRPPVLAWQPNGQLLGVMDDLGSGGVLRIFDPAAGTRRVVALDPFEFNGLVWSPDGTSLASLTSSTSLLVVGTDASWRTRVETTWSAMLGWVA